MGFYIEDEASNCRAFPEVDPDPEMVRYLKESNFTILEVDDYTFDCVTRVQTLGEFTVLYRAAMLSKNENCGLKIVRHSYNEKLLSVDTYSILPYGIALECYSTKLEKVDHEKIDQIVRDAMTIHQEWFELGTQTVYTSRIHLFKYILKKRN